MSILRDFISFLESSEKRGTWFISLEKFAVFMISVSFFSKTILIAKKQQNSKGDVFHLWHMAQVVI
tara:strand:- start:4 stop:201 length:198 start_codon:yes stop_codon:yes gene_type:complete